MRSLPRFGGLGLGLGLLALAIAGGRADALGTPDLLRIHLLWTNDLHGHIAPEEARFMNPEFPPPLGGAASAAGYIKRVRAEAAAAGEAVLLVDVGDMFQGTPIGNKTKGEAVIAYFNEIGYDFAVPGNHDFDFGREVAEARAKQSEFPWVAANLVETATGEVVPWCVPTLMLDVQGVKIGVIGIITPGTKVMSFPENIAGLDFLPMAPTIARYRDALRAQGADLIFLGIHEGLPFDPAEGWRRIAGSEQTDAEGEIAAGYGANYSGGGENLMELMNRVPGVDIAVGGHTHRGYQEPWIDPVHHTLCFESFGNGSSLGHAILIVDRATRQLVGWEPSHDQGTLVTLFEDEILPDTSVTALIAPYREQTERELARVVGESAVPLPRGSAGASVMGNLVTDAMRERFDADFSFQNLGGLRADLPAGAITAGDVFSVLPFGNELVVVEMDGRMVRRVLERKVTGTSGGLCVSGVRMEYDPERPDWDRVVTLEVAGEPWQPDRIYKVVTTNFLLEGNSGLDFLTAVPAEAVMPTQVRIEEALEWYLAANSPVRPRIDDRWLEAPGKAQAPYLQVDYLP
ncbi:MAG TPA: bifunctional UDP-sugar hydrolase/5'-nucleotidase [Candidatus Krumholzibacteria bacterium]|nr:bifunctional UDP-sugar hydrolase/5'-nucleotidase [Candidatus Krumholzibacteria bacterium]HPD72116.1 bifunctional UDP-sugar hydrolase/5'-nucleotidase [Candidatus Krumholzibacteria bacterium]HRY40952.1 bifunctional UDP-sugar hydrolase/5'-nucleotidase [Candidatus Krumholzibacteria bacterium]